MELERLDGSDPESAVRIEGDAGEVFLGRGPLLRITEVGMSRKHAKIHFEAGKWTLTALQNKPCYVQKPGEKLYTPLEKDREQLLDDGCKVSLLENKFTYKIIIPMQDSKGEKSKLEPVATKGDLSGKKRSLPAWMMKVASKNAKESPSKPPQVAATTKKKETKAQTTSTSPKKTPSPPAPRSPPKKKKKFDTSYESEPEDPERTPKKKGGTHCLSDQEEENEETTPPPKYSRKTHDLSDADDEDELTPVKNNVSPKKRSSPPSSSVKKRSSPLKPVDAAAIRSRHALSDEDESDEEEDIKEAKKPEKASSPPKRTPKKAVKKLSAMSDSEEEDSGTGSHPVAPASRRPACPYGGKCYRKNPQHKIDEAHPGDSDYDCPQESESDPENEYNSERDGSEKDEDDRPECEYGIGCYRKNPSHQKAYKHTKKTQPRRTAKAKAKKKTAGGDDSGEDTYESSFIDDDSEKEDISNDDFSEEEWVPTDED